MPIIPQISNGPISNLPFELLRIILDYAIPPRLFLNPSFSFGPNSAWSHAIRQLKSHVLVCKMWWEVGIGLLYQDVTIRRVDQIPALLRSFELNTRLGPLVRNFQVHCYVPHLFARMLCRGLSEIPSFCPNITRLVINHETEPEHSFDTTKFQRLFSKSILDLELSLDSMPINHLALCSNLLSLTINIKDGTVFTSLIFDCLEDFHCIWHSNLVMERGDSNEVIISERWTMPHLKRLSLYNFEPKFRIRENPRCLPFLRKYGKNLIYLSLRDVRPSESWEVVLSLCPSLRHLAVQMVPLAIFDHPLGRSLCHPTLEYIDLWGGWFQKLKTLAESIIDLRMDFFPALRDVRIIDHALFGAAGLRLPISISPDWSKVTWIYRGIDIFRCHSVLVRNDLDHVDSYYEIIKSGEDMRNAKIVSGDDEDAIVDSDNPDDYEWFPSSRTPSEPPEEYEDESDMDEDDAMSLGSALELFTRRRAIEYANSTEDESDS